MKFRAFMLAFAPWFLVVPTASAQDVVSDARKEFAAAYTGMHYDRLCAILHPEASFRGSLKPDRWSHTSDQIVKERWNVSADCDCKHPAQCKPAPAQAAAEAGIVPFTVGQSDMILDPDTKTAKAPIGTYFVDNGTYVMKAKSGVSAQDIRNPYVIIWMNSAAAAAAPPAWKMLHIDMHPCGDSVGRCP